MEEGVDEHLGSPAPLSRPARARVRGGRYGNAVAATGRSKDRVQGLQRPPMSLASRFPSRIRNRRGVAP